MLFYLFSYICMPAVGLTQVHTCKQLSQTVGLIMTTAWDLLGVTCWGDWVWGGVREHPTADGGAGE